MHTTQTLLRGTTCWWSAPQCAWLEPTPTWSEIPGCKHGLFPWCSLQLWTCLCCSSPSARCLGGRWTAPVPEHEQKLAHSCLLGQEEAWCLDLVGCRAGVVHVMDKYALGHDPNRNWGRNTREMEYIVHCIGSKILPQWMGLCYFHEHKV